MSHPRPLRGACNCGRNQYLIVVPQVATERIQVIFDQSSENRRSQAAPLTAWLRVPIAWYQSHTRAYYFDETHASVRRTFQDAPHCKRNFCGFCGTHLTYWSEQPPEEADYLQVTLGSLHGDDIRALEDLDLVPRDVDPEDPASGGPDNEGTEKNTVVPQSDGNMERTERHGQSGDVSWFEEMLDGSSLGRSQRRRRGHGMSADGTVQVEWEISEYREGDLDSDSGTGRGKRKIGETGTGDDVEMKA